MLSGLKFVPRDQIDKEKAEKSDDSDRERSRSGKKKNKHKSRKNSLRYDSSGEDDLERIPTKSNKKKKWYSSDEGCSSSNGSESEGDSDTGGKRHRKKKRVKRSKKDSERKSKSRRSNKSSEDDSLSDSGKEQKDKYTDKGSHSVDKHNTVRKEMGLEWMLRPKVSAEKNTSPISDLPEEPRTEEVKKENPRELNPYYKNNGMGYPEEEDATKVGGSKILSASIVGDGGASWRLKALKRSQEQAAREGRDLQEVVQDRWGSLGQLTVSVASRTAAPSRSHLHAIRNRQRGVNEEQRTDADDQKLKVTEKNIGRERQEGVSHRHPEMKVPKVHDSLSWGKKKGQFMSTKDASVISSAMSSLNKFTNDGSFMREVLQKTNNDGDVSVVAPYDKVEPKYVPSEPCRSSDAAAAVNQGLSANQLAAKAMQLRLKGKHEEAEILLKEVENMRAEEATRNSSSRQQNDGNAKRYAIRDPSIRKQKQEDDADMHLARKIMQNSKFSISGQADDEYDFEDGPRRKSKNKVGNDPKSSEKANYPKRILTQQERCQFCFENPSRPRHLVIAIANFTYLSLPHWQSVVPGHCCILTLQHESSTRAVDDNVWDEIRNFKKCLFMMFAKQNKDVVFLETVMGLAKQRRHCMVECIPLPQDIAGDAPLYFKKAIDEAEDEWSQHNSKKLIDTNEAGKGTGKGLRASIPKDFPYFHVEFGPSKGFVHVIDNEEEFKSNFGINVIRGLMELPEEDMYGRRKRDSLETQTRAVASFSKDWAPFDWTKQLDT